MTPSVLSTLAQWEPSAPRLTWYGPEGERVELSGRVLANWVVKAANLLVSECSAGPGSLVRLDLPAHWRLLVWALGSWATGGEIRLDGERSGSEIVVTDHPEKWLDGGADEVVAVALAALARSWPTALPPGVIDGAAEVMGQPDQPLFAAAPPPRAPVPADPEQRVLLLAEDPARLVERVWSVWSRAGSVVLVTPRPEAQLASIRDQEGVRAR